MQRGSWQHNAAASRGYMEGDNGGRCGPRYRLIPWVGLCAHLVCSLASRVCSHPVFPPPPCKSQRLTGQGDLWRATGGASRCFSRFSSMTAAMSHRSVSVGQLLRPESLDSQALGNGPFGDEVGNCNSGAVVTAHQRRLRPNRPVLGTDLTGVRDSLALNSGPPAMRPAWSSRA